MISTTKGKHSLRTVLGVFSVVLVGWLSAGCAAEGGVPLHALEVGGHPVRAEIAGNQEQRERGLMYRTELAADQGMLFVYPVPGLHAMWMRNTRIPLAVAFIDESGHIINIEEMQPETLDAHGARGPARYSLEMNGGWFARHHVGEGALVTGLQGLRPQ